MIGEAKAIDFERRGEASRMEFSRKTNPNRPAAAPVETGPECRGEATPFPDRADPRHPHGPLTEDRRELATRYMPLARAMARRVGDGAAWQDDLEAEAYAALVDAARTFDPERGVDFAVYARPRIMGALRDYRRFLFHAGYRGDRDESPVFQRLTITDAVQGRFICIRPEAPPERDIERRDAVEDILRRLPRSEAIACRSIYVDGRSSEETAQVLGCSKGHLSRLHNGALERIRRVYREAMAG